MRLSEKCARFLTVPLRRSYVKMGIHSRQELLDTLEEMESRLLRD